MPAISNIFLQESDLLIGLEFVRLQLRSLRLFAQQINPLPTSDIFLAKSSLGLFSINLHGDG